MHGELACQAGALVEEVRLHDLWRAQLNDVADEMVLDAAINGRADALVTFNIRHFGPAIWFGVTRGRPKSPQPKVSTTIRLDADIVARFRAGGPGWQSRINAALRAAMPHG